MFHRAERVQGSPGHATAGAGINIVAVSRIPPSICNIRGIIMRNSLTILASAAALAMAHAGPAAAQDVVDLADWDYQTLYEGWMAESMIGAGVIGENDEEIGEVENIIIGPDNQVQSIIVEAGGFLDIGDTHLRVPWDQVELGEAMDTVTVPVSEENVDDFTLFEEGAEPITGGPRAWRATELIDDYVYLEDGTGYGLVQDLVFSQQGELQAVILEPDVAYDVDGPYALPYYGYDYGFDPGYDYYELPYTEDDIAGLDTFDDEAM